MKSEIYRVADDTERKNLDSLLDEIFGEENRLAALVLDRSRKNDARFFSVGHEYIVIYARDMALLEADDVRLRETKEISLMLEYPVCGPQL